MNADGLGEGDVVECMNGWQDYKVHKAKTLRKVATRGPLTHHMSVLGVTLPWATRLMPGGNPVPATLFTAPAVCIATAVDACQLRGSAFSSDGSISSMDGPKPSAVTGHGASSI